MSNDHNSYNSPFTFIVFLIFRPFSYTVVQFLNEKPENIPKFEFLNEHGVEKEEMRKIMLEFLKKKVKVMGFLYAFWLEDTKV